MDDETHAPGYAAKLDSGAKWVHAALAAVGAADAAALVLRPSGEPNDTLASQVAEQLAKWSIAQTTAREAGVADDRAFILDNRPPQEIVVVGCNWMRRHINQARREDPRRLPMLPSDWGKLLAGRREVTRAANQATSERRQRDGTRYHHKHDVAPSQEQLTVLTRTGFEGDARVAADVADAVEAGMAVAVYLPTGARGSELKKMRLQSLGHEVIQDAKLGLSFDCLKLMAFDTKTKAQHLNQFLEHADAMRDGVGLFGLSILVRVRVSGTAPPTTMQATDASWYVFGANVATLDERIKAAFRVAGVRRQKDDPVTYLGRHYGTRLLQHAGGSSEGGAARTGHASKDARQTYTECPLPDLQKLAGRDVVPAPGRLHAATLAPARKVRDLLYPDLAAQQAALALRQEQVDRLGVGKMDQARTREQLNDQERLLRALDMATLAAVRCLVARPRTWKQWKILEAERTLWETGTRVTKLLFEGNAAATAAMHELAAVVRRCEDAEVAARCVSPEAVAVDAIATAVSKATQQSMAMVARLVHDKESSALSSSVTPVLALPVASAAPTSTVVPLACATVKRKREAQDEVTYISTWKRVSDMLSYARAELWPREAAHGTKWRTGKRVIEQEDGTRVLQEDKAKDKQWRCYRAVAVAVGRRAPHQDEAAAVAALQARLDVTSLTRFLKELHKEAEGLPQEETDALAKAVLAAPPKEAAETA